MQAPDYQHHSSVTVSYVPEGVSSLNVAYTFIPLLREAVTDQIDTVYEPCTLLQWKLKKWPKSERVLPKRRGAWQQAAESNQKGQIYTKLQGESMVFVV